MYTVHISDNRAPVTPFVEEIALDREWRLQGREMDDAAVQAMARRHALELHDLGFDAVETETIRDASIRGWIIGTFPVQET